MARISRRTFLQAAAAVAGGAAGAYLLPACGRKTDTTAQIGIDVPTPISHPSFMATATADMEIPRTPFRKGMQVTWNSRMKLQGSTSILAPSPDQAWFSREDVARLRQAGAGILEIHQIGLPDLMPKRNICNEGFFAKWVDVWVDWCTRENLDCILTVTGLGAWEDWALYLSMPSWIWEGLYDAPAVSDQAAWDAIIRDFFDLNAAKQDANREAFLQLWAYTAARYRNNPHVLFGIMNEPFNQVAIPGEETAIRLGNSYSAFMEKVVDGIRGAGAGQNVVLDIPFLWDSQWRSAVQPVNRDGIIWEAHSYVGPWGSPDLPSWKAAIDAAYRKIALDFHRPLFVGEYGISPPGEVRTTYASTWKSVLAGQVAYLNTLSLFGRQYHCWDEMYGEYGASFSAEETEWILDVELSR